MNTNLAKKSNNYFVEHLYSSTYTTIDSTSLFKFMNVLHYNKEVAYISLMKKDGKQANRWSLQTKDISLLNQLIGEKDLYCSVNDFFCPGTHNSKGLKTLNALIIDLDYYNQKDLKDLTAIQVYNQIKLDLNFPTPSFVIDSGRGLYMIWLLYDTFATQKSKNFYSQIEQTLVEFFDNFGADQKVKDTARVLRMVGSVNSKTNRQVSIITPYDKTLDDLIHNPIRYELSDIANFFWGFKYDKPTQFKSITSQNSANKKNSKPFQLKNIYSLNYTRIEDIEKLMELRQGQSQKGHREKTLAIYMLHLLYTHNDYEIALQRVLKLNELFYDPLNKNEIESKMKNLKAISEVYDRLMSKYTVETGMKLNEYISNNGAYIYKNKTIIKELKITLEEQKYMKTLISSEEKKNRKDKRNIEWYQNNKKYHQDRHKKQYIEKLREQGKLSRDEKNNLIRNEIKKLLDKGLSNREIAKELDMSHTAINKHIQKIKEEIML